MSTKERLLTLHDRPIAFPDVTSLAELFPEVKPAPSGAETPILLTLPSWEAGTWSDRGRKTTFEVGGWLSIDGVGREYQSYHVQAAPRVLEYIKSNMLHGPNDRCHFEAHVWDDGQVLVTCTYSQILGSHYLAVVDACSLPT